MKPIFELNDYKDSSYVMHCDTEYKAKNFLALLNKNGKKWCNSKLYTKENNWETYGKDTCYCFNEGTYCDKYYFEKELSFPEKKRYIILEYDDFDWIDNICKFMNKVTG